MRVVEHIGRVVAIHPNHVEVMMQQQSACASCHAKGYCNPAEKGREIVVKAKREKGVSYAEGESVMLLISESNGFRAVFVTYLLPVLLCLVVLVAGSVLGIKESYAALATIAVLVIYFVFLFIFARKSKGKFDVTIEKIDNL